MNLTLQRTDFRDDGIFGTLLDEAGNQVCVTLEHAYDSGNGDGSYAPKVPAGTYLCQQGQHQLAHMSFPFTTYQIMNVPNHTNILFHQGNYNDDSDGCVLVGAAIAPVGDGTKMITSSANTFKAFIELLADTKTFNLVVKD